MAAPSDFSPNVDLSEGLSNLDGGLLSPTTTNGLDSQKNGINDYALKVKSSAEITAAHSLYPRDHFSKLSQYLQCALENSQARSIENVDDYSFATLYDLRSKDGPKFLSTVKDFESAAASAADIKTGQLLFLKGLPSPEWLIAVGAAYNIDPDLFRRHLDFRPASGRLNYFSDPYLPSAAGDMYRLLLTTIGEVPLGSQKHIDDLREESSKKMDQYFESLKYDEKWILGDSIVRHFDLFQSMNDEQAAHYTIEQDISILVQKTNFSWICVAWLDVGRNLGGTPGPWNSLFDANRHLTRPPYYPVVQRKSSIALKPTSRIVRKQSRVDDRASPQRNSAPTSTTQSASLLHSEYGRDLDRHRAASDPIYAMHDLFAFAATSELQFLNMMRSKIKQETSVEHLTKTKNPTIKGLLRYKHEIKRHYDRFNENLLSLQYQCDVQKSPRSHEQASDTVTIALQLLQRDYQCVLSAATSLMADCDSGIQILMNNAVLEESQKAMLQQKEITKLTLLAFFFIPLSFTSSFFGMNFAELNGQTAGGLSLWIFFATSVPILATSVLFLKYEIRIELHKLWLWLCEGTRKSRGGKKKKVQYSASDGLEMA